MLTTLVLLRLQALDELSASLTSRIGKPAKGEAADACMGPSLVFSCCCKALYHQHCKLQLLLLLVQAV